jgi:MtN3 and saliva related transmembrane protein
MNYIKIIGLAAGTLTTISFLPQVIRTWKTRSAKDLSWMMFSVFFLGTLLWLSYGILMKDLAITVANSITAVLSAVLIYFKVKFKNQ